MKPYSHDSLIAAGAPDPATLDDPELQKARYHVRYLERDGVDATIAVALLDPYPSFWSRVFLDHVLAQQFIPLQHMSAQELENEQFLNALVLEYAESVFERVQKRVAINKIRASVQ